MGVSAKSVLVAIAVAAMASSASTGLAQYAGPSIAASSSVSGAPESAMKVDYENSRIMPGDVVAIATLGVPELTTTMSASAGSISSLGSSPVVGIKVSTTGQVELPYLGTVVLAGLTPSEAAAKLGKELKERGILVDPQITVDLVDSPTRVITVIGEVQKPSPVPALRQVRLLDAISVCGGLTPLASHTVTVRRVGNPDPIVVELGIDPRMSNLANIPLLAGDTVIVPKVGNVFVVGEVKTEQALPLAGNSPITVMRAISMVGGLKYSAALSKTRIIRTTEGNRHVEIRLDLAKLMNGKQQDIALAADDVLFIPANPIKAALMSGGASVAATLLYGSVYAANTLK